MAVAYYQMYRSTTIGIALEESLQDMLKRHTINQRSSQKILQEFDRSMNITLTQRTSNYLTFKAKLLSYRACDQVWTLVFKNIDLDSYDCLWAKYCDKIKFIAAPALKFDQPSVQVSTLTPTASSISGNTTRCNSSDRMRELDSQSEVNYMKNDDNEIEEMAYKKFKQ
ncbi:unnamed protein product [Didymodactylos carnosus]|nr:unnamed protein product [Didymodactylos carnosus]CAF3760211.1 unnamed protein product [Didymodactylos carnosus]